VILCDLWWNPQIEAQAFDRAHRMGQTEEVKVYKITVDQTVEQRFVSSLLSRITWRDLVTDLIVWENEGFLSCKRRKRNSRLTSWTVARISRRVRTNLANETSSTSFETIMFTIEKFLLYNSLAALEFELFVS
jgi:hypothetical protein